MYLKSFRQFSAEAYKTKQKPAFRKTEEKHLENIYNAANSLSLEKWLLYLDMEYSNKLNAIGGIKWKHKCVFLYQKEIKEYMKD